MQNAHEQFGQCRNSSGFATLFICADKRSQPSTYVELGVAKSIVKKVKQKIAKCISNSYAFCKPKFLH